MRIVLSSVLCLYFFCVYVDFNLPLFLACMPAVLLSSFLSVLLPLPFLLLLPFLLAFLLYCLLPSFPFPISLYSVLPFYLSVFLVWFFVFLSDRFFFFLSFSLACALSCVFLLSLFSFRFSFLSSLFFHYLTPSFYSRFFFLPSLLSCFLSFSLHVWFLVFLLFLLSSLHLSPLFLLSVALPYPTTK